MDQTNVIQVYDGGEEAQVMTLLQPQQATIYTTVTTSEDISNNNTDDNKNNSDHTGGENFVDARTGVITNTNETNNNIHDVCQQTNNQLIVGTVLENTPQINTNNKTNLSNNQDIKEKQDEQPSMEDAEVANSNAARSTSSRLSTRFKWTKEKSQVAMNLVKYGCKPKLVSVAVGCSLRTAQKFVETVTPKMEGESFKNYVIRRRGRKSKDVNERLEAIREVLSKDSTKTQVEIAADLKVSNTTVCRDLKKIKGHNTSKTTKNKQHPNKNLPASR